MLRADRSLAIFPALSTAFATGALALTLTPGLVWSAAADQDWIVAPFLAVGAYVTTFFGAAIGLAVFLVAALPVAGLLNLALQMIDIDRTVGAGFLVLAIVAAIAACAMGSALGVIFRVELYRYSTEGQATGGFARKDMVAAFGPPTRARPGGRA